MIAKTFLLSVIAALSVCCSVSAQTEQEAWQCAQDVITTPLMAQRNVTNKVGVMLEKGALPLSSVLGLVTLAYYVLISGEKGKEPTNKQMAIFVLLGAFSPLLFYKCLTKFTSYLQKQPHVSKKVLTAIMAAWSEHRHKMPATIREDIDAIIQQGDTLTDPQAWALVKKYQEAAKVLAVA